MKSVALLAVGLLGALCLYASVGDASEQLELLKQNALELEVIHCRDWHCDCAFKQGCCCASDQLDALEETTFVRMMDMWGQLTMLHDKMEVITGTGTHIAFTATMSSRTTCFGPFNTDVTIPYDSVSLNHGNGYNSATGVFTAFRGGIYVFSFTAYSSMSRDRLYHKVQLMMNGKLIVSIWEDNREDLEDSGTQTVGIALQTGDQIYVALMEGRRLCGNTREYNLFSGHLQYAYHEE